MFWADKFAKQIINSGQHKPYWVDDMKTPSGRVHIGALRGVVIHDLVYQALLDQGVKGKYTYIFDDHDPMDELPIYLDRRVYQKYMGCPLNTVLSPKPGYQSYADYFAREFIEVFNACGCHPEIIWTSELYHSGKMNQGVKLCLDNAEKIRKIYKRVAGSEKPGDWYPFQVVCEKCGKVGTTKVIDWDGKKVTYQCSPDLVAWAAGCGHQGKVSPFDGAGKLPWKVEWAVKWQAIGVTVEGAGKDHMSAGGSFDIASAIYQEILNHPIPYSFSYEFFLVGGRKMSSSKGLGSSAREVADLLPPAILRFLMTRISYKKAIDFDPGGNSIPDLFDEYDRCAYEWFKRERKSDLGRIFELSQVDGPPQKALFLPRFREVANLVQMPSINLVKHFESEKGAKLNAEEKTILDGRIKYAKIWLDGYAPKEMVFQVSPQLPDEAKKLSQKQKEYLNAVTILLKKEWPPEELQHELYELAKKLKISSQKAFQAIYLSLIGKTHGPKAAWLILSCEKKFIMERLKEVTR